MKKNNFSKIYMAVVIALMYVPIVIVIVYSFNESKISSIWSGTSLKWYVELFNDVTYLEAFINSVILASVSSVLAAIIGTLGAYGMSRVNLKSKKIEEAIITSPIMIPEIILGMTLMVFFAMLGMKFGMVTLIIAHTAFCIPYVYLQVKARLVGLDKSLEEAALDLGASRARAFFDVVLPLVRPAILSGMVLSFAMSLDDVIISVFVTGVNVNTLPLKIYSQLKTGLTPKINALCTLMFLLTIFLCIVSAVIKRAGTKKESSY